MEAKEEEKWLEVLKVSPGKRPEVVMIEDKLEALQEAVGGLIQVTYPFEDPVGVLLNEEGKLLGLEPNRALRDEEGDIYDILCGDFFVVGLSEDGFCSLTEAMKEKYEKYYHTPEMVIALGGRILVLPMEEPELPKKEKSSHEIER